MWFIQSPEAEGSQYQVAEMDPSGHIVASAELSTPGATQADTGVGAALASASDGGVWVEFDGLTHVGPDGSVRSVALPGRLDPVGGVAAGSDGDAWLLGCATTYNPAAIACDAVRVTTAGDVTTYPLPSFAGAPPSSGSWTLGWATPPYQVLATADGVWLDANIPDGSASDLPRAAFVTYAGQVTPVSLPSDSRLIALGSGGVAWWQQPADGITAPSVTLGQVTPSGSSTTLLTHSQPLGDGGSATIDQGPDGSLLWATNYLPATGITCVPTNPCDAGFVGTITPEGETRYTVGSDQPAIAPPTPYGPDVWSLSCNFGISLYEATDGNIWIASAGHPSRLSVLTANDSFSTFLPIPESADDSQIYAMQQSTTGAL